MSQQAESPYVLTLGETMALMSSEQVGPLAHSSTLKLGIGGAESNVAIGLQRLGVQAVWCGRVGDDSLGRLVEREIRAEGVDVRIAIDPAAQTGLMIKERRIPSAQRVSYYRAGSAGSRISTEDVGEQLITKARLLHVSGITPALSASAKDTVRYALATARAAGIPVSFDLNYRANLWDRDTAANLYREMIPQADIIFASDNEASIALGATLEPEHLARRIASLGPSQTVIKLGTQGAIALVDGQVSHQKAITVDVVDTVGAGDAFVAGYLAECLAGLNPPDRLRTAAITGAFACLTPGDWESFPRRHELEMLTWTEPVSR